MCVVHHLWIVYDSGNWEDTVMFVNLQKVFILPTFWFSYDFQSVNAYSSLTSCMSKTGKDSGICNILLLSHNALQKVSIQMTQTRGCRTSIMHSIFCRKQANRLGPHMIHIHIQVICSLHNSRYHRHSWYIMQT